MRQLAELPKMPEDDKVIALRIFMLESLKNQFKSVCAEQGRNMSEVVTEFVEGYVHEHRKAKKK